MSSYADAAASSGPTGANKIPEPTKVKNTSKPSGGVEVLDDKEFEDLKKEANKKGHELREQGREKVKDFKKELGELESEGKSFLEKVVATVKEKSSQLGSILYKKADEGAQVTSNAVVRTKEEFKNPVVITQALVTVTGAYAGYLAYAERRRINTDNKVVLAIHGSVITGLILADAFLFGKYYPKYDKKGSL